MVSHAARIIGFVLWGFLDVCLLSAKGQPPTAVSDCRSAMRPTVYLFPYQRGEEASHAWVGQIAEDSQGFLWFATRDGLDRYDGYQLRPYSPVPSGCQRTGVSSVLAGLARYALLRILRENLDWSG